MTQEPGIEWRIPITLCGRNYHVLIPISNQTLMSMCSDFFFFCPIHISVVISSREANVPRQIYNTPVTPCTGISRGRLISSASCLRHIRSSFPALQPCWAPQTGSEEGKAALLQSIYIKGLTLQSQGSAERGYK